MADLTLLLLGFAIMVHVAPRAKQPGAPRPATAINQFAAANLFDEAADPLFEDGEARLTAQARARLAGIGQAAARRDELLQVQSLGAGKGAARFDRWELSAARAAAVARALGAGGMAQDHIDLTILPLSTNDAVQPQRILVSRR